MSNFSYVGIFSCPQLLESFSPAIVQPIKVDLLTGKEKIRIFRQWSRIHPIGIGHPVAVEEDLVLPEGKKLIRISVQSKEGDANRLETMLNEAITKLSILLQPQLFFDVIYKGPIVGPEKKLATMSIRPAETTKLTSSDIESHLAKTPSAEMRDRFSLMSNFYARSLDYDPSPEKFFLLWTVLEIFPMKDTSNIAPLRELVKTITNNDQDIAKNLDIGRLYGKRCEIVHDGTFNIANSSPDFTKLEMLVHEALRSALQLPYGGLLDRYKKA